MISHVLGGECVFDGKYLMLDGRRKMEEMRAEG